MAGRFTCAVQLLCLTLLGVFLNFTYGIVGRDLILTPKEGLQLTGKSIYYEEDATEDTLHNQTKRPWERTLKHVTYVTLFTNAATGAAAGNVSKLQEYNDFVRAPYIQQTSGNDARFGDIVTLANGRLEHDARNGTYRFVEGHCGYDCADDRVWALWQVQKIRHHDAERKFRYEMKFSVSPLRGGGELINNSGRGGKRMAQDGKHVRNVLQTYIQKESDYPQSFERIIYPEEADFADRHYDETKGRHFRPSPVDVAAVAPQRYAAATPMPQSTFVRGIFQPHPGIAPPLERQRLNIGEYMKNYKPQSPPPQQPTATPKIELFPNLLQLMAGNAFATPTTYRPHIYNNYQMHFDKPAIYAPRPELLKYAYGQQPQQLQQSSHALRPELHNQHLQQPTHTLQQPPHFLRPELLKYEPPMQQSTHSLLAGGVAEQHKITTPMVTHHFHHHFYMPGNSGEVVSPEQQLRAPAASAQYKDDMADVVTPPYFASFFEEPARLTSGNVPAAPQKIIFPSAQLEQQRLVHVTPVPPLKKPHIYAQHYPIRIDSKVPLLIYPAPVENQEHQEHVEVPTPRQKPFIQSEPMNVAPIRYSEPDPLYLSANFKEQESEAIAHGKQQAYEQNASQLEAPKLASYEMAYTEQAQQNKKSQPDSIADQLPPPDRDQDVRIPYVEESQKVLSRKAKPDLEATPTDNRQQEITTEKSAVETVEQIELQQATIERSTTTATNEPIVNNNNNYSLTESYSSVEIYNTEREIYTTTPTSKRLFVSTSSTETPLRALARYRPSYGHTGSSSSSSTEQPVLKWKPRRKQQQQQNFKSFKAVNQNGGNKAKLSKRYETKLPTSAVAIKVLPTATTTATSPVTATTKTSAVASAAQQDNDIFEVLTQKSVSKSVSIKVGSNGEEIPVLIDDSHELEGADGDQEEEDNKQNASLNNISTESNESIVL